MLQIYSERAEELIIFENGRIGLLSTEVENLEEKEKSMNGKRNSGAKRLTRL